MDRRSFFQRTTGVFVAALAATWRMPPAVGDISRATAAFWQARPHTHGPTLAEAWALFTTYRGEPIDVR